MHRGYSVQHCVRPGSAAPYPIRRIWERRATRSHHYILSLRGRKPTSTYRVVNAGLVTGVGPCVIMIGLEVVWIFIPPADRVRLVQICHCSVRIIGLWSDCVTHLHFSALWTQVWSSGNKYFSEPDLLKPRNRMFMARTHSIPSLVQDSHDGIFSSPEKISTRITTFWNLPQELTFDVSGCRISVSRFHARFETRWTHLYRPG